MRYVLTFLEGVLSFLSPCMLPLLPVYLSFFAGGADRRKAKFLRIAAFIAGFTLSFMGLGLLFSALGAFLARWQRAVEIAGGAFMIAAGLSFLDVIPLPFFRGVSGKYPVTGVLSAFCFGLLYPLELTPCVGAFLGSALALAAVSGSALQGILLLFVYAMGLGIPFLLSALIMSHLDALFAGVKSHYAVINRICGGLLIVMGLLMALGWFGRWMRLFG